MATIGNSTNLSDALDSIYDTREIKRGEIYYLDLDGINYSSRFVQQKTRPALIIQNDIGNQRSGTVIVALLTTSVKKPYPFQYQFVLNGRDSVIMCEQIMTVDRDHLLEKTGELTYQQMRELELKLMYSLQLNRLTLENIIDFDVISVITKKTKRGTETYFEIQINFEGFVHQTINITLENLQKFNSAITNDIDFDELKKMLDNCKGLHWLVKNNEI